MSIKEELFYDFNINMPRVLINGRLCIVDNVKKIVMISSNSIVVGGKGSFVSIKGNGLSIREIDDERVQVIGGIETVEFFKTLS